MTKKFTASDLHSLYVAKNDSQGEDNGQVTIVGGSTLFQGAPLLSAIAASRIIDMLFIATPLADKDIVGKIELFSRLRSCIWIPREDLSEYIEKSNSVLIGPGLMRGEESRKLTSDILHKYPHKQWVIDAGSLQTMDADWIPKNAIVTPNSHEYAMLFADLTPQQAAEKYHCVVVTKGPTAFVTDGQTTWEIEGGNAGLTKGGTGDVLAGVILGLSAQNPPLLAAAAGCFLLKKTAEKLAESVGNNFSADDVAANILSLDVENF